MGRIFISYRRDDAAADARGIRDRLAQKFGKSNIFMDVDNLLAGQRFDRELERALAQCEVLIAVIGSRWMDLLAEKSRSGDRDYVREEIAAALKRGIVVIPLLVGQEGRMPVLPRESELPEDIRGFVQHQRHNVVHESFGRDIDDLIADINAVRRAQGQASPWRRVAAAGLAAIAIAAAMLAYRLDVLPWGPPGRNEPASTVTKQKEEFDRAAVTRQAEEAAKRQTAEVEARRAEAEAKQRAEAEARQKADEEARRKTREENTRKAEEEARRAAEEEAKRDPALAVAPGSGRSFRDRRASGRPCTFCPEMVVVPAGSFTMGSPQDEPSRFDDEGPQRVVTFQRQFAVGKFAITFDEWDACAADGSCNAYWPPDQGWGRDRRPVINVSWNDAQVYVAWLSRRSGKAYRLLSEAEREYVTRAGTKTPFWWGGSISPEQANYDGTFSYRGGVKGEYRKQTVVVDSFQPNPWGLHQVHGNVWEWVQDCHHGSYRGNPPTDGSVWESGDQGDCSRRMTRGGSWFDAPQVLGAAIRTNQAAGFRRNSLGFRVSRMLAP